MAENRINKNDIADLDGLMKELKETIALLQKLSKTLGKDVVKSATAAKKALQSADATTKKGQTIIKKSIQITNQLTADKKKQIEVDAKLAIAKREFRKQTNLDIKAAQS